MLGVFEIAGGSVAGRDHVAAGRNNQDAFAWHQDERCTIAVVADGCSEGAHSEVGAQLGARLIVDDLRDFCAHPAMTVDPRDFGETEIPYDLPADATLFVGDALQHTRRTIADLAERMGGSFVTTVHDYFLFTAVGVVIAQWGAAIFSIGDGVTAVNGAVSEIGPFPNNMPPYLAYGLFRERATPSPTFAKASVGTRSPSTPVGYGEKREKRFLPLSRGGGVRGGGDVESFHERSSVTVHAVFLTDQVHSILLGTDGVVDLIVAANRNIPGKDELVGPLAQFWTEDRYFKNPDMIRRRLTIINRDVVGWDAARGCIDTQRGLLPDDAALVAIRRRKE